MQGKTVRMKTLKLVFCLLLTINVFAQPVKERLNSAMQKLLSDTNMKHATIALTVADASTGEIIFAHNGEVGLAPASTQKTITAAAALELLGKEFKYKTNFYTDGKISAKVLNGNIIVVGSGDPTIGSWRYKNKKEDALVIELYDALKKAGIERVTGSIIGIDNAWDTQSLPGGWTWDDMGNYYGAGSSALNWKENQYDLIFRPGAAIGDNAAIVRTEPKLYNVKLISEVKTAAAGTGDNSSIYLAPYSNAGIVRGTIPVGTSFKISGSVPDPSFHFVNVLHDALLEKGITITQQPMINNKIEIKSQPVLYTYTSPTMDSIVYWFLQKSVNFYGEVMMRTIGLKQKGSAETDEGVSVVRNFFHQNGIERSAFKIIDGSGLSPQNRVTTNGLAKVLQYAKTRSWFDAYYAGFPTYNAMKLKSGSIGGSRAFAGYHTSKNGQSFVCAMIINNYDGSSGSAVQKMFKVLDELK
jgi:D-alanyl-D-alanine carboxypeptidase/D-alanyl-D-alanine-endopeptidase (penicillin-binding protein 4)